MTELDTLRDAALQYAAAGIRVFPVLAGRKEPATAHGVKDASIDAAQIQAWWSSVPYLIGIACGPESGVFVIDVDPRNGGVWTCPVRTASVRTGGRYDGFEPGVHSYFRWPAGVAKLRPTLLPGVDVQGAGKYVIAPPSVTQAAYEWIDTTWPPAECPAEVLAEIAIPDGVIVEQRPGDAFNASHTWPEVLEPYGWVIDHEGADGETYWTRPGKDSGVSATTNYQDSDLFYVFSTSTGFESERGYDKFGVYAILEHGGDVSAAAAALGTERPRLTAAMATPVAVPSAVLPTPAPSPAAAQYEGSLPSDHLITQFITYCGMVTDASPEYTEAAALALLATVTSGMRVALAHVPDGLRTNLYTCLVGPSSIARKSTVQQIAVSFLQMLRPNAILPDRFASTESAIAELGQRSVALWMPDELGQSLQQIYTNDLKRGLEELLLTLYSGQAYRYVTLARGEETVSNIDLNVFGAGTPESFSSVGGRAMGSGLLPRFGIVYPARFPESRPPIGTTEEHKAWRDAIHLRLRQVLDMTQYPGSPRAVTLAPDALALLGQVDAEFGATPMTARLVTATYKVTALIALGALRYEATAADAAAAIAVTRRWAAGAKNLRRFLGRPAADIAAMEQVDAARDDLRLMAAGRMPTNGRIVFTKQEVARRLRLPAAKLKQIRDTLESTGEVIPVMDDAAGEVWHVAI